MRDNNAWLKQLKAGDEVAVCFTGGIYGPRYEFMVVGKTTAKFYKVGAYAYRKEDGEQAGNRYHSHLVQLTPELRTQEADKKRHRLLVNKISEVRWRSLPLVILEAVDAALSNHEAEG